MNLPVVPHPYGVWNCAGSRRVLFGTKIFKYLKTFSVARNERQKSQKEHRKIGTKRSGQGASKTNPSEECPNKKPRSTPEILSKTGALPKKIEGTEVNLLSTEDMLAAAGYVASPAETVKMNQRSSAHHLSTDICKSQVAPHPGTFQVGLTAVHMKNSQPF